MKTVTCPYCGAAAERTEHFAWGTQYECVPCDARVGCHRGTDTPLGTLANAELRAARKAAHAAFDPIWKTRRMSRARAYTWLARALGIRKQYCHIGMFNVAQCEATVSHCLSLQTAGAA